MGGFAGVFERDFSFARGFCWKPGEREALLQRLSLLIHVQCVLWCFLLRWSASLWRTQWGNGCDPLQACYVTLQQLLGSQGGWWCKLALQDKKVPVATAVHLIFQSDYFKAHKNHFSPVQACLPQFMCTKYKPRGLNVAGWVLSLYTSLVWLCWQV